MLVSSISSALISFSYNIFKGLFLRVVKNLGWCGNDFMDNIGTDTEYLPTKRQNFRPAEIQSIK